MYDMTRFFVTAFFFFYNICLCMHKFLSQPPKCIRFTFMYLPRKKSIGESMKKNRIIILVTW